MFIICLELSTNHLLLPVPLFPLSVACEGVVPQYTMQLATCSEYPMQKNVILYCFKLKIDNLQRSICSQVLINVYLIYQLNNIHPCHWLIISLFFQYPQNFLFSLFPVSDIILYTRQWIV